MSPEQKMPIKYEIVLEKINEFLHERGIPGFGADIRDVPVKRIREYAGAEVTYDELSEFYTLTTPGPGEILEHMMEKKHPQAMELHSFLVVKGKRPSLPYKTDLIPIISFYISDPEQVVGHVPYDKVENFSFLELLANLLRTSEYKDFITTRLDLKDHEGLELLPEHKETVHDLVYFGALLSCHQSISLDHKKVQEMWHENANKRP